MRAPDFWWVQEPDFRAAALAPLAALYGAIAARRMAGKGVAVDAPVICIGNFVAGGAGKTPTALAVANVLRQLGERPFFLSRGYGASRPHRTPLRVDIERHDAGQVGDEPLLLAREAPTIVCADRIAGAQACVRAGASVIVMDDVGPAHIPTVAHIRSRFTERRKGSGAPDRLLRRLLGQ